MKRPSKIAIIGAGGITCHLAPSLSRLCHCLIIDGDKYEPGNVERQFPAMISVENKAKALSEMLQPNTLMKMEWLGEFAMDTSILEREEWKGVEMIFGCVDNNASRRIVIDLASVIGCPAVIAGNKHVHGEAHLYIPMIYDPFDHFEFPDTEPTPWSCNSDKNIEENPQTPMANAMASAAAMHILLSWEYVSNPLNCIVHSRLDSLSSSYARCKDILAAAPSQAVS